MLRNPVRDRHVRRRFDRAALATALVLGSVALAALPAAARSDSCLPNCPPVAGSAYGHVSVSGGSLVVTDSYNSQGGVNSAGSPATGVALVTLPGLTASGGTVNVTGYSHNCTVSTWSAAQAGTTLQVRCYDTTGAPVTDGFSFSFTSQRQANNPFAYAWISDAVSAKSTPDLTYQFDQGSTITVKHPATGSYTVSIPFAGYGTGGAAKVTAVGSNAWCSVPGLSGPTSTEKVKVKCTNPAGAAVDTQFTITFMRETDQLDQKTLAEGYAEIYPPASTGSFLPVGNYFTWDSAGGSIDGYKSATGLYSIHIPGLAVVGNAQITTVGTKANRCRLVGVSAASGTTNVQVVCTQIANPAHFVDTPFLLQVTSVG